MPIIDLFDEIETEQEEDGDSSELSLVRGRNGIWINEATGEPYTDFEDENL